jgi:hypothetical protein
MPYYKSSIWQKRPRRVRVKPARVKENPRTKTKFNWDFTYLEENGVTTPYPSKYACVGQKQVVNQGIRVNLNGVFTGITDSYNVVQIKTTSAKVDHGGLISGRILDYSYPGYWRDVKAYNIPANSRFMNTVTEKYGMVQGEEGPIQSHKDYATVAAHAALSSPKCDVGMMAAEIGETINLIRRPLSSLVDFFQYLTYEAKRKARLAKTFKEKQDFNRRMVDVAANTWLEHRYAMTPLMRDVDDLAKTAAEGLLELSNRIHTVRGGSRGSWTKPVPMFSDDPISIGPMGLYLYWVGKQTMEQKSTTHVYYREKTYMETALELEAMGLSPTQIPGLLWELTPFSFCVDWFYNVGDWIKAWSPHPTVEIVGSSCSTTLKQTFEMELSAVANYGYNKFQILRVPKYTIEVNGFTREADPALRMTPMQNPNVLGIKRSIDALALTWGNMPRFLKTAYNTIKGK